MTMPNNILSAAELIDFIHEVGFLPLLNSGIAGYSKEEVVDEECRYVVFPDGGKTRGTFDGYVTRLQMGCYVVTEDFIYPKDKHGNDYGWGWLLLTTPEQLYGSDYIRACLTDLCEGRTPQESRERILRHLRTILPDATDKQLQKLI